MRPYLKKNAKFFINFAITRVKYIYNIKYKTVKYIIKDKVYIKLYKKYNLLKKFKKKFF